MDPNSGKVYDLSDPDIPDDVRERLIPIKPEKVYWNGLETTGIRGTAIVAEAPEFPEYWAKDIVGQRIEVAQINLEGVNYGGGIAYLDNRVGDGWVKVTQGKGSPAFGHRDVKIVPGSFEINEEDRERYFAEVNELKEMKQALDNIVEMNTRIPYHPNRADRRAASKKSRKKARGM